MIKNNHLKVCIFKNYSYLYYVMREMITLLLCLLPLVGPALLWKETLKDILYVK